MQSVGSVNHVLLRVIWRTHRGMPVTSSPLRPLWGMHTGPSRSSAHVSINRTLECVLPCCEDGCPRLVTLTCDCFALFLFVQYDGRSTPHVCAVSRCTVSCVQRAWVLHVQDGRMADGIHKGRHDIFSRRRCCCRRCRTVPGTFGWVCTHVSINRKSHAARFLHGERKAR